MFRNIFSRSVATFLGSGLLLLSLLAGSSLPAAAKDRQEDEYYGTSSDEGDGTFDNDAAVDSDVPDPEIIRAGDAYYMSSTSMHFSPGVPIMKSYDLVNWKVVNYVYNIMDDNDNLAMRNGGYDYGKGSWATSLKYREYDKKYYLSHTSNTTGKTYFYRTDDIENGIWERVSVCDTFFHDASMMFVGEDIYMFHGSGSINVSKLKSDFSGEEWRKTIITSEMTTNVAREFYDDPNVSNSFLEATHAYRIGNTNYVFMCGWPGGYPKMQYVFKCDSVDGTYEGKVIISDNYGRGEGVAQGGIVQKQDGQWMGFFMHNRGAAGRGLVLTQCEFDNDGWPVVADAQGKIQNKVMNIPVDTSKIEGAQKCENWSIVTETDFDNDSPRPSYTYQEMPENVVENERYAYNGSNLPLGFEWNHNPDNRYWSLTERDGYLRLTNGEVVSGGYTTAAKNTLTARTYGPESYGSVAMEIDGMKDGDVAGFGTFNRNYGYCGVKMENGKKYIIYRARKGDNQYDPEYTNSDEWTEDVLTELDDSISRVYFKIYNDYTNYSGGEYAHFYYSTDGEKWVDPGKSRKVEFGYPSHFAGSRFGIFSFATKQTGGYVDVDYFKLGNVAPVPLENCTVTFDPSEGTGEMQEVTMNKGETYILPDCAFTAPEGKQFKAWNVNGEEKAAGSEITVNEDITVAALWEDIPGEKAETFTVTFNTNGGSKIENVTVEKGGMIVKPAAPVKSGYIFDGWYMDEELTDAYDFDTVVTDNMTLYAKWRENNSEGRIPDIGDAPSSGDRPDGPPRTGDWTALGFWSVLAGGSVLTAGAAVYRKKSRKCNE